MFFNKKKASKPIYGLRIQFLYENSWNTVTRKLDEDTTNENAQALAIKIIFQIKNSGKIDIGGIKDCLSGTHIYLIGIENATVDIGEERG